MAESDGDVTLATATGTDLLEGLKSTGDNSAWRQYTDRYRPMLVRFGRRAGLAAHDAEDVAQHTLMAFNESYRAGKYDRDRGRLRDWLFGIARNQLRSWRRTRPRGEVLVRQDDSGTDAFHRVDDERGLDAIWEQEWRDSILRACLDRVRGEVDGTTFEAFDLFAVRGMSAAEVGRELGMTANAVFIAKHRVLKRIRQWLPQIETTW